ncbi:MAG: SH3 domain-containing protein, partial [Candidatus Sulfotelmatobacter sp.]
MNQRFIVLAAILVLTIPFALCGAALADALRGTLVHPETLRVAPSADAARVGDANRGNELIIISTSRDWTQVEAILRPPSNEEGATEEEEEGKAITGWIPNAGLVI